MSGIQSKVQCVLTLDLGRFQSPRASLRVHVHIYRYRARARKCIREFTHVPDIRDGNHRYAPGLHIDVFMHRSSRKLLEYSRHLSTAIVLSPNPSSFNHPVPFSRTTVSSICYPLRKTSDEVEDWLNHPLTFQCLALPFFIFLSLVTSDSPSPRRGQIAVRAALNSMCRQIRPLRSTTAYPSGIIRSKGRFSAS